MNKFTFFWKGPFSNWAKTSFVYKGITFTRSEQAMMWEKAMLFGDTEIASKILKTDNPSDQKELGRQVKGYVDAVWNKVRESLVFDICKAKFSQNLKMKEALMATGETVLVEASKFDTVWGIGLTEDDPRAQDPTQWKGLNLLGIVLTGVREEFKNEYFDALLA